MHVSQDTPFPDPGVDETRDAIERHSVNRHSQTDLAGETIVLCPPISVGQADPDSASSLEEGYAEARRHLALGKKVRLIAHGSTLKNSQPDWADDFPDFARTEVGAYRHGNPIEQTRVLAENLRAWLDRNFSPATRSQMASDIFYGSAAGRMFQPLFDAVPYVRGLAAAHPDGEFVVTNPTWPGVDMLRDRIARSGGSILSGRPRPFSGWRFHFGLALAATLLRSITGQFKNYLRSASSRAFIRRHRVAGSDPDVWIALVPDWQRINGHVVERIARPLLEQNVSLGVVLVTTLAPGERFASKISKGKDQPTPWPALDQFASHLDQMPIAQLVRPLSPIRFVQALIKGGVASFRIGWRLLKNGPQLGFEFCRADNSSMYSQLAALATTDVLQVAAAREAFEETLSRRNFTDKKVFFASMGLADTTIADRLLHQSGATTFNYAHGTMNDAWYGEAENCSDRILVWTSADMENCRRLDSHAMLFPPVMPAGNAKDCDTAVQNVLFLTNYLHHDWATGNYPLRPFMQEILLCRRIIGDRYPARFRFRWRPHPSDVPEIINQVARDFPDIELSATSTLAEDLIWADIAVANPSTVILDALTVKIPIFVHCAPAYRNMPEMRAVDSRRKFFHAEDILSLFTRTINGLENDRDKELEPERSLRKLLIGSDGAKTNILSIIGGLPARNGLSSGLPKNRG